MTRVLILAAIAALLVHWLRPRPAPRLPLTDDLDADVRDVGWTW